MTRGGVASDSLSRTRLLHQRVVRVVGGVVPAVAVVAAGHHGRAPALAVALRLAVEVDLFVDSAHTVNG
jgi:hypothetical protein